MKEFYVGYAAAMPPGIRRLVRRALAGVFAGAALLAGTLVLAQQPFPNSSFEFGNYRTAEGVLLTTPYPALLLEDGGLPALLVGAGKHGAPASLAPYAGHRVRLMGERIAHGSDRALEVRAMVQDLGPAALPASEDLGEATMTGEIVDSKCYFGVMNPGNRKPHRDCAVRCLSGGVPPAFLVRDADGQVHTLLLAVPDRAAILEYVAEPVIISGRLKKSAGRLVLHADAHSIRRPAD